MNRKQLIFTLLLALLSGLMGGVLSIWFLLPPSVLAQDSPQKVIEAQEFRVVDEDGRVRAMLGAKEGDVGLLIRNIEERPAAALYVTEGEAGLGLFGSDGTEKATLYVVEDEPVFTLKDGDEKSRVAILLENGEPRVALYDVEGNSRIVLRLSDSSDGGLVLQDDTLRHRLIVGIVENEPMLQLYDQKDGLRVTLGTTELKNQATGSTEIRAPSSLVLIDEEGKVVWSAP